MCHTSRDLYHNALAKHDQIYWSAKPSLHRRSDCCVKTRCWLVHLLRRCFIFFISSLPDTWKLVRFLLQFMLRPLKKRKKPSNDLCPPPHLHLLLLGNPCLLMDEEMGGSQRLRRTMVRLSWTSFEHFLPPLQGDGGAYPECHIAQYPLDMGRKKVCFLEYIPMLPSHGFIGFLRKHISPSSGQRGQCSLRCYCTPRAAIWKAGSVSVQGSRPVSTPEGRE
jgi:hypothetical protein